MLCRNRVQDFAQWKAVFDAHATAHRAAGLRLVKLWQGVDQPDQVFFVFEVASYGQAMKFITDPDAAKAGAAAGVLDGEYHFVEDASDP